jgi:predicted Zn-dependent protease
MLTREQAQELARKAIAMTMFPECAVSLNSTEDAFIRFALNGVTTSGFVVTESMSISVTKEHRTGNTSVDELTDTAIREGFRRLIRRTSRLSVHRRIPLRITSRRAQRKRAPR